jgi:hypothetical protein
VVVRSARHAWDRPTPSPSDFGSGLSHGSEHIRLSLEFTACHQLWYCADVAYNVYGLYYLVMLLEQDVGGLNPLTPTEASSVSCECSVLS